jgi:hypothetical protein
MRNIIVLVFVFVMFGCANKGDHSNNVCEIKEVCFALLNQVMLNNWVQPDGFVPGMKSKIRIVFIDRKDISKIVLIESSGNKEYDESVVEAVNKSKSFMELDGFSEHALNENSDAFSVVFKGNH